MLSQYLTSRLAAWRRQAQRHRTRRRLKQLDCHLLEDIGVDRQTAAREARKPFWKP
ncbi:DUF1127 domain-containing protein [Franzmannia qiaohouensis]|uniref:DUF1127 domain-containing protein n=1 Tax=Franzmannia qiaohouensis TaxID=1329370 RepID=A0ABU1HAP7_9GAMM|nr:DUF1127 domain-containing protein [Halomonas qiaohouensis]MDR5903869.1 DUF1127 domain-containing protein [Halomonas qiaohouensis]